MRATAADLRAIAIDAEAAYKATEPEWRREVAETFRPRLVARTTALIEKLQAVHDREYAALVAEIEAARAAGVMASTLPLNEMTLQLAFGRIAGESYFQRCRDYLRRHGWLS